MASAIRAVTVSIVLTAAAVLPGSHLAAQSPPDRTLAALTEGTRIRTNGPAVRDELGLSVRDVLQGGIMSIFIRPPAEGIVVGASPASLRFAAARGPRLIDVPWSGIDYLDVHQGRSAGLGAVKGAGLGALTGLAMWGIVELIFLAADNPVVDEPGYMIGIGAGAGAVAGAVMLGDRWERVYPPDS